MSKTYTKAVSDFFGSDAVILNPVFARVLKLCENISDVGSLLSLLHTSPSYFTSHVRPSLELSGVAEGATHRWQPLQAARARINVISLIIVARANSFGGERVVSFEGSLHAGHIFQLQLLCAPLCV